MAHRLEDYLWDIHKEMKTRGLPEMDDDTLRELSKHLQHPTAMQQFQSGQLTATKIVDEVQAGLRAVGEGGLINDRAGIGTQRIRNQLGYSATPQSASQGLPFGGSRIAGQGTPGSEGFGRRDLTFRSSVPLTSPGLFGGPMTPRERTGEGAAVIQPFLNDDPRLGRRLRFIRRPL